MKKEAEAAAAATTSPMKKENSSSSAAIPGEAIAAAAPSSANSKKSADSNTSSTTTTTSTTQMEDVAAAAEGGGAVRKSSVDHAKSYKEAAAAGTEKNSTSSTNPSTSSNNNNINTPSKNNNPEPNRVRRQSSEEEGGAPLVSTPVAAADGGGGETPTWRTAKKNSKRVSQGEMPKASYTMKVVVGPDKKKNEKSANGGYHLLGSMSRTSSGGSAGGAAAAAAVGNGNGKKNNDDGPLDDYEREVVKFFSGNPCVEVTSGVVHLFRNREPLSEGCKRLCVLAVPSFISIPDFYQFTSAFSDSISAMRILRDPSPHKYMVIVDFRDASSAAQFYDNFNGKPFSSMEPQICHVLCVEDVEFLDAPPFGYHNHNNNNNHAHDGHALAAGSTELPTCPVCLERLDAEISGIMTILCNHSFHSTCLGQWQDNSCPVCRFCQEPTTPSKCMVCDSASSLWMCLICGNVGCGRYEGGHASSHYKETMHRFSMELVTQSVWDYEGDGYVHRLILNKADGKLVEFPSHVEMPDDESFAEEMDEQMQMKGRDAVEIASKMDAVGMEYTYLLTSQLDTQRQLFEQRIIDMRLNEEKRREQQRIEREEMLREIEGLKAKLEKAEAAKKQDERRIQIMNVKMSKQQEEIEFLRGVNDSLKANQDEYKNKITESAAAHSSIGQNQAQRIQELEQQVQDLMFFLDTQKQIESMDESKREELKGGAMLITEKAGGGGLKGSAKLAAMRKKR